MYLSRSHIVWALAGLACVASAYVLWPRQAATDAERRALAEGRTIIVYWDRHSGHEHEARMRLIDEFNERQSEVYVRGVAVGFNALMEKTLTSTAGHAPPDVQSIDSTFLAQLAPQGIFRPLDDLIAEEPSLHREKFFPFCWDMVFYSGHVWGIPTTTDSYCLLWNKAAFRKAGLDPERPPRTLQELTDYAAKLTIRGETGEIEQMGFLPWLPWDLTHMWGALFGGEWFNYATGRAEIAQDEHLRAAYEWQQSFAYDPGAKEQLPYAMDPERIEAFSKGFGEYFSASNPFYSGKVAMIAEGEWQVTFIPKYAPGLDWGVAPIPQPEGAPPLSYGPAAVVDVIPSTARHPEAAKKFLRWFYSPRPNGGTSPASDYTFEIHNIATRRDEAVQERFVADPKFRVFVNELLTKPVASMPNMPVSLYMMDQIERQRSRVVFRRSTPEQALRDAEAMTNRALDRVRALMARGGGPAGGKTP